MTCDISNTVSQQHDATAWRSRWRNRHTVGAKEAVSNSAELLATSQPLANSTRGRWSSSSTALVKNKAGEEGTARLPGETALAAEEGQDEGTRAQENGCDDDAYLLFAGSAPGRHFGRVHAPGAVGQGDTARGVRYAEDLFNFRDALPSHATKGQISDLGQTVSVQFTRKLCQDFERLADGNAVYWPNCLGGAADRSIYDALYQELGPWKASPYRRSRHPACVEEQQLLQSEMYRRVVASLRECFDMEVGYSIVNLYADGNDWTEYHRDCYRPDGNRVNSSSNSTDNEAPLPHNVTVGVSFGASRELRFKHLQTGLEFAFPQGNGDVFAFTEPVNSAFQHCVPQCLPASSVGPRISVILWGRVDGGTLLKAAGRARQALGKTTP